jgi:hypothetical protein
MSRRGEGLYNCLKSDGDICPYGAMVFLIICGLITCFKSYDYNIPIRGRIALIIIGLFSIIYPMWVIANK